ncbi:AAA family ATPase [Streptomyces bottropensis]|uniref:AAA family ATPase n=1 Tax=Streptomyces bottropensis TaxID=42235 RepID=A0ABU8AVF2_9ACTN
MTHDDRGRGTIITFYSFKGGTGRTMALVNTAWILASNGLRVLVVDWDLEAPGLHTYLQPLLADPELTESAGVIEMVKNFARHAVVPRVGSGVDAAGVSGPSRPGGGGLRDEPDPGSWLGSTGMPSARNYGCRRAANWTCCRPVYRTPTRTRSPSAPSTGAPSTAWAEPTSSPRSATTWPRDTTTY